MSLGTRFSTNEKRGANVLNQRSLDGTLNTSWKYQWTHVFSLKETKRGSSSTERTKLSEHPRPSLWTSNTYFKKFSLKWVSDPWRSVWFQVRGKGWTEWAGGTLSSQGQVIKDEGGFANRTSEPHWRGSRRPDERQSDQHHRNNSSR